MDSSFQDSKSIPEYNPGIPSLNVGNRLIEAFWCLVSYKRVTSFTLASLSSEFYSCFTVSEHLEQQSISAPWWNLSAFLNLFVCLSNEATALKCRHCGGSSERIQNLGKCVFFFCFFDSRNVSIICLTISSFKIVIGLPLRGPLLKSVLIFTLGSPLTLLTHNPIPFK